MKLWFCLKNIIYAYSADQFKRLRYQYKIYAQKLQSDLKNSIDFVESQYNISYFSRYGKRHGINLANHLSSCRNSCCNNNIDTYEVRVLNSSFDIIVWQNNVEFFASLFKYSSNNHDYINYIYKNKALENNFINRVKVSDMLFNNDDSKFRFLNKFELNKDFDYCKKISRFYK